MSIRHNIMVLLAALLLPVSILAADDETAVLRKAPAGSVARQLQLKAKLLAETEGLTLTAMLDHNRSEWDSMPADQRDQMRRNVLAFLDKSPQQQEQLIKDLDELVRLSSQKRQEYRQRAQWLKAVIADLAEGERQKLLELSPEDRAKLLLEHRDEMVRQGRLDLSATTAPATSTVPTTQSMN